MRSLFLFCALALAGIPAFSQNKAVTPPLPSAIFFDDGLANVLCARVDADYDNEKDPGDSPASWLVFDPSTLSLVRSQTFDWSDVKVSRCGSVLERDVLDVIVGEDVLRYQISTQSMIGTILQGKGYGLDASLDLKTIWMSERPSFTDPGSVIEYTIDTKEKMAIPVGVNPQQLMHHVTQDGQEQVLVICEGLFGKDDGTFRVIDLKTNPRTQKIIEVGDTPNYFVIDNDTAYVVVNGSHKIVIVDLLKQEKVGTLDVGTTGFNGPREAVIWFDPTSKSKMLLVSTFLEEIRVFNLQSREFIKSIKLAAKPEGIALRENDLWVTQTFLKATYEPASDVVIYDLFSTVTVNDREASALPKAILATSGSVRLPFEPGSRVTIADITGRLTPLSAVVSGSQTIDCSMLPHGTYLLSHGEESVKLMR